MTAETVNRRTHPEGAVFMHWKAADGWPLRVMDWPPAAGALPRGSLLFLGGHGDFAEKYIEAMAHWHGGGWHVTTFDWRGQGGSRQGAGAAEGVADFDPLVADLGAFVAAWQARTPGPHVAVAHSMGGHLLLRALAEHDPPFAAVILVAPMIGINSGFIPSWLGGPLARLFVRLGRGGRPVLGDYQARIAGGAARRNRLTSSAERYADESWWHGRMPGFDIGAPTWSWILAAYRSIAKLTPAALARVRPPVLILAARRDHLVDGRAIRKAAALLPRATLIVYPDAAHEILREDDHIRLPAMAAIDAFLARHAAS